MPAWLYLLTQLNRRLWLSAAAYSLLGLLAALLAAAFDQYVPSDFPLKVGSDSVDDILSILASSMLAVATFSLTTLVTAYTAVGASAAPRASELLVSDRAIRSALGTFVGAFIYAVVGIVALHTGYYGAQGRVILFFVTLLVLVLVILAMLRWIGELSGLGQTGDAIDRVAQAAERALGTDIAGRAWRTEAPPPSDARPVVATKTGFIQNVDLSALDELTGEGREIWLTAGAGDFVHPGRRIALVRGEVSDEALCEAITVGNRRTFDQDPRYGLEVLGEIAARALSPGVNDPGTAKAALSAAVVRLDGWARRGSDQGAAAAGAQPAPLSGEELLSGLIDPLARHGAAAYPLQLDAQALLAALRHSPDRRLARAADQAAARLAAAAREALESPREKGQVTAAEAAGAA